MAKWVNSATLDNGLNHIKNNATKLLLISAYSAGDSYAAVLSAAIMTIDVTSTDFTLSSSGSNRLLTTSSKTGTASGTASGSPDLHIAFTNGIDTVLWVTDETTNQPITTGNTVTVPSAVYTSVQPE